MGFKVIKDLINDQEEKITGREYQEYKGGKNRIRLLDDDGNIYLYLFTDVDYMNESYEDEQEAFAPLDYFMYSYGLTELQYKTAEGEYKTL